MKLISVMFRPLLTSGTLATNDDGRIVINEEQPELEQLRALCHETAHLLGIEDEAIAEHIGLRIADACPELLRAVMDAHGK